MVNYKTSNDIRKPIFAVDIAVFTFVDDILKLLTVKREEEPFKDQWALAGGLLDPEIDVSIEDAVIRKLKAKTSVAASYMEQLKTYGNNTRSPRGWEASVAYIAFIPANKINFSKIKENTHLKWININNKKSVSAITAFDHKIILNDAIARIVSKLEYSPVAAYFLDSYFTIKEFQTIHEVILKCSFTPRAFVQQIEKADILERLEGKFKSTGPHRPAQLYKLKKISGELPMFFPRQITRR